MKFIPQLQYSEIIKCVPILCVDGVILNEKNQALLLRRSVEPEKGRLWFPGGRVIKNEFMSDAIVRKVKEETGLTTKIISHLGHTETIFNTGPFGEPVHTVNFTYLLSINDAANINIDSNHVEFIWFDGSEEVNPEIIRMIKIAKITKT